MSERNPPESMTYRARTLAARRSRELALTVLVVGLAIAFGVPAVGAEAIPGPTSLWAIIGALVAALGLASFDIQHERADNDERQLLVRYRAMHVSYGVLIGLLGVFLVLIVPDDPVLAPQLAIEVTLVSGISAYFASTRYYRRAL